MNKNKKKTDWISRIPKWAWLLISLAVAILVWTLLSQGESTGRAFPPLNEVFGSYTKMAAAKPEGRGVFWGDVASSLTSAGIGFLLGFVIGVPVAFLMAWYRPVRYIVEPWIQFIRNIPPLAYVPLVVIAVGVGRTPQIVVICLATFLTISITVFQGVINVDETLIKAARVLGANDTVLFVKVIFPATTPFIITAVRLGISVALTTLIAAESTGASAGLGMRIRALSSSFETAPMMLYIIVVGVIGMLAEKILKFAERRLTSWQEKREI
ncbi:MAG: ABC transporter permease [Candidatus Enterenecus sp.]